MPSSPSTILSRPNDRPILDQPKAPVTDLLLHVDENKNTIKVTAPGPQGHRTKVHDTMNTLGESNRARVPQATPRLVVYNPHASQSPTIGTSSPGRQKTAPTVSAMRDSRATRSFYVPAPLGSRKSLLNYYRGTSPHALSHLASVERARADARIRRIRGW